MAIPFWWLHRQNDFSFHIFRMMFFFVKYCFFLIWIIFFALLEICFRKNLLTYAIYLLYRPFHTISDKKSSRSLNFLFQNFFCQSLNFFPTFFCGKRFRLWQKKVWKKIQTSTEKQSGKKIQASTWLFIRYGVECSIEYIAVFAIGYILYRVLPYEMMSSRQDVLWVLSRFWTTQILL